MAFYDLAGSKVKELQEEALHKLQQDFNPDDNQEEVLSFYTKLYKKINFEWKPADQNALIQLREAAEEVIAFSFVNIIGVLDRFYDTFRVAELNHADLPVLDAHGRVKWKLDKVGRPVEDFSSLNGQDIEKCLLDIARERVEVSQAVSELFLEAIFAKFSFDDEYRSKYDALMDGTINDKDARAKRDTINAKYFAFFRYYLWYRASAFDKEIGELVRLLERIRQWRILDDKEH